MNNKYYYMKKSGDVRWLYPEGETVIKVYPREDKIISAKYNTEKDETTIKCEKVSLQDESVKRFRLAYIEESKNKSDEEIKSMISEIMKEKKCADEIISAEIKRPRSYYEIESERSRLTNNNRRNYRR